MKASERVAGLEESLQQECIYSFNLEKELEEAHARADRSGVACLEVYAQAREANIRADRAEQEIARLKEDLDALGIQEAFAQAREANIRATGYYYRGDRILLETRRPERVEKFSQDLRDRFLPSLYSVVY